MSSKAPLRQTPKASRQSTSKHGALSGRKPNPPSPLAKEVTIAEESTAGRVRRTDTESTLFSDTRSSEADEHGSSLRSSRCNSMEWSNLTTYKETSGNEDGHEEELDEIMFRQDPAWTRSQQRHASHSHPRPPVPPPRERAPSVRKATSPPSVMGSFEAELEKTSQMMSSSPEKNSASLDMYKFLGRSIHFEASERSKDFDRFLPTTMPGFIGDVFGDMELEDILKSVIHDLEQDDDEELVSQVTDSALDLQSAVSTSYATDCSMASSPTKKKKKKKEKKKSNKKGKKKSSLVPEPTTVSAVNEPETPATTSKSDLWLMCNPKVTAYTHFAMIQMLMIDFKSVVYSMESIWDSATGTVRPVIHFCIPSDGKRNIIDALSEGILKLDGVSDLVDSVSDIFSLTDTKPDSTPQSVDEPRVSEQLQLSAHMNLDLAHLLVRANELETVLPVIKESKILSVKYHSQLSMALAKSVVPIEVGQLGWTSAVENLVAETCGWISIIAECPSELPVLSTLMYLSWTPEETTDRIMLSFSSVEIDNALRLASPVETNQDVLCLIRWSLFENLGQIIRKAQKDGFILTALKSTTLEKRTIREMCSIFESIESQELSQNILKTMCPGPVIVMWLQKRNGLSAWLDMLKNIYGDSNFSIPLYQEGFLAPPDYIVSKHWARLFFPSGPAVQLEYQVQDSHLQCIQSQHTFVTQLLETPLSRRHPLGRNVSFSLVFKSHSLSAGTNMNSWGEALHTLMHLRARNSNQHLRLDGLKMVNFSDEVASGIVTSLKDSESRRETAFELAKGPCVVVRFSGNPRLYDILKHKTTIMDSPYLIVSDTLIDRIK